MEYQRRCLLLSLFLVGLLAAGCRAGDDDDDDDEEYQEVKAFLLHYGYLRPLADITQHYDDDEFENALSLMQSFANINNTGLIDGNTLAKMRMPRCGNPDSDGAESLRKKRYNLAGPRWKKRSLTYRIARFTEDFSQILVEQEIERAFKVWSDVTPLTFRKVPAGNCDIVVLFAREEHGDGHSFDGRGGTLAHAYFPGPGIGGDAHFDDDEHFTSRRSSGTNLFLVAAHEFGHSLGLGHSDQRGALMAPYYQGYKQNFILPRDDIRGIQELYGVKKTPSRPNEPKPPIQPPRKPGSPPAAPPNACMQRFQGGSIIRGEIFLFQNEIYWRLKSPGVVVPNHPMNAENLWYGFQSDIDAVYERKDGTIIFTKGSDYWEYNGVVPKPGFPKSLADIGLPQDIDAAFVFPNNGKTYVFRGSRYWRYDERQREVDSGYPKNIRENWKGIPSNVDAAFPYNGFTYFVRGQEYWKFNNVNLQVERGYPKNFPHDFLDCKTARRFIERDPAFQNSALPITAASFGLLSIVSLATLYLF
ncbi:matrix metalloproteinase-16-like [Anneissia japonica]|uniref:matrix metalloproteinase-16-like n=1 Tax=Anneissia japonica TaxID=1529436 RepID=UPI0014256D12|nr:matrix metalloproteinase-16-like [Anneissia japonica]